MERVNARRSYERAMDTGHGGEGSSVIDGKLNGRMDGGLTAGVL